VTAVVIARRTGPTCRRPAAPALGVLRQRVRREDLRVQSTYLSGHDVGCRVRARRAARNRPSILTVDTTVRDVDRQAIRASSRPILVHRAATTSGSRSAPAGRCERVILTNRRNPVAGVPVESRSKRARSERHRDDAKIVDTQTCNSSARPRRVSCRTSKDDLTSYHRPCQVADARGRINRAQ